MQKNVNVYGWMCRSFFSSISKNNMRKGGNRKEGKIGKKNIQLQNCFASLWSDKASALCQMWKSFFVISFFRTINFPPSKKAVAECRNLDIIHSSHLMCLFFFKKKVSFMPSRVVLEITLLLTLLSFDAVLRLVCFLSFFGSKHYASCILWIYFNIFTRFLLLFSFCVYSSYFFFLLCIESFISLQYKINIF